MKLEILTDEQLLEVVNTHMELIEPDTVLQRIEETLDDITNSDTEGALENAYQLEKLVLISLEMYKKGFIAGQVLYNEAIAGLIEMKEGATV